MFCLDLSNGPICFGYIFVGRAVGGLSFIIWKYYNYKVYCRSFTVVIGVHNDIFVGRFTSLLPNKFSLNMSARFISILQSLTIAAASELAYIHRHHQPLLQSTVGHWPLAFLAQFLQQVVGGLAHL